MSVSCDCSRIVDIAQIEGPLTEWLSQFIPVVLDHFSFQGTTPWNQGLDCPAMLDHFKSSRKVQTNDLFQCFTPCFRSTHQLWSVHHCAKHILSFGLFGNPKRSEVSKTNTNIIVQKSLRKSNSRAHGFSRDWCGFSMEKHVEKTWKNLGKKCQLVHQLNHRPQGGP